MWKNAPETASDIGASDLAAIKENQTFAPQENQGSTKKFSMESFTQIVNGAMEPQFSLKEINAKKGDTIVITIMDTKGEHNFNIDEYDIHTETPVDRQTDIEFKANKVGSFVYYCSKPGHRQAGQWGTLNITE